MQRGRVILIVANAPFLPPTARGSVDSGLERARRDSSGEAHRYPNEKVRGEYRNLCSRFHQGFRVFSFFKLLTRAGLCLHGAFESIQKGKLVLPSTTFEWIGFEFDTGKGKLWVLDERRHKLIGQIQKTIVCIVDNGGVDALGLAAIIGKLVSVLRVIDNGNCFLSALYKGLNECGVQERWAKGIKNANAWVEFPVCKRTGNAALQELRWWLQQLDPGKPLEKPEQVAWVSQGKFFFKYFYFVKYCMEQAIAIPRERIAKLRMDASGTLGCGAILSWWDQNTNQHKCYRFQWAWEEFERNFSSWLPASKVSEWHINAKEFVTIVAVIIWIFKEWKENLFGWCPFIEKIFQVDTDNMTAKHYANCRRGDSKILTALAKTLQKHLDYSKSQIWAQHRLGENNVVADAASRGKKVMNDPSWEWTLPWRLWGSILKAVGIDRFDLDLMGSVVSDRWVAAIDLHEDLFTQDIFLRLGNFKWGWIFPPLAVQPDTMKWLNKKMLGKPWFARPRIVAFVHTAFVHKRILDPWYLLQEFKDNAIFWKQGCSNMPESERGDWESILS